MTQLIRYEAARNALAEAHRVDEVKDIRDKAEAMAAYARQAKDSELIQYATEIKVRAERRCGELLARTEKNTGARGIGTSAVERCDRTPPTLDDMGLTKSESSRYQQLAAMPADHFETAVATAKATAGEVTTAFMLREAKQLSPYKKLSKADRQRLADLQAAQARGVSMLCSYARLTILALGSLKTFTEEDLQVLEDLQAAMDRAPRAHAAMELSTGLGGVAADTSSPTQRAPAVRNDFTKKQQFQKPNVEVERAVAMLDGVCFILRSIDPSQLDGDRKQQWALAMKKQAASIAQFASSAGAGLALVRKAG